MAKLPRYNQKIFASSAGANKISEFGSFAAGSPARYSGATITPDIVQMLSNYLGGWPSAVVGNNAPLLEDMDAIGYLFSYQLAYLMQAGIAEWETGTVYYENSLVNDDGRICRSQSDTNSGNDPTTDGDNWGSPILPKLVSEIASNGNMTVSSGQSLMQTNLTVSTGDTYTINSGAYLVVFDVLTINGTLTISGTSRVI